MLRKVLVVLLFVSFCFTAQWKAKELKMAPQNIDPVYMLNITNSPKFNAKIILSNGTKIDFCCPKAMFDFYFRPLNYPEYKIKKEEDFKQLLVKDYMSGKWIDAKKALFIFGSHLKGPKGDDLIPFSNKENLNIYMIKYGGSKILDFKGIKKRGFALTLGYCTKCKNHPPNEQCFQIRTYFNMVSR